MSNLAETILRDVPRYGTDPDDCDGFIPTPDGAWLDRDEVLAALTAAMDPAIAERAGKVVEGVSDGAWKVVRNRDKTLNVVSGADADGDTHKICLVNGADEANARFIAWCREGVPALLAQNAALQAQAREMAMDVLAASGQAQEAYQAQLAAEEKLADRLSERDALRADRDAQRRDLEKTIRNQRAELRRLQALERVHWQSVERWRGTREGLEGKIGALTVKLDAAEAQNAALTARVEGLTGALRFYADPADYKAPFTGGMGKLWNDCGGTARAALSATKEEGHD